jgi:DNA-binding FrmR family transcriptional regulator
MTLCGDYKKLVHRINRIKGQVSGLKKMVEDGRDCFDVLKQVAATLGAVRSLGTVILESHLQGCVSGAIGTRKSKHLIQEVVDIFNKFSR